MFSLALTCKCLYIQIMDRTTLSWGIRLAVTGPDGAMRWMYPIRSFSQEWRIAYEALMSWSRIPRAPESISVWKALFNDADDSDASDSDYVPDDDGDDDDGDGDGSSEYSDADPEDRYGIPDDEDSRSCAITVSEADSEIARPRDRTVPIPFSDIPDSELPDTLPLLDPDFPLLAFLRRYYGSEQARSRRRRWNIIKQFDVLWTNYRRDGWERDDFVPAGTTWVEQDGQLVCSHSELSWRFTTSISCVRQ